MAKQLKRLRMTKVSGVDHPAHLGDGWMVMKAAGEASEDELDAEVEALIEKLEGTDVPEVTKMAGEELAEAIKAAMGSWPGPAQAHARAVLAALSGKDEPTTKSADDALAEALARAEVAETALAKASGPELTPEQAEEAEVAKAMLTLPEPLRKAWEADRAKVAKAEKMATDERDARLSREYLEVAKSLDGIPAKAEDLGTLLRKADDNLDEPTAKELRRIFKALNEQANQSNFYSELGGVGTKTEGAQGELDTKAAAIMKADPGLTRSEAVVKAADTNPDLVARMRSEAGTDNGRA